VRLKFVDWNLNGFTGVDRKLEFLAATNWDVCALQEVTRESYDALEASGVFSSLSCAHHHMPALAGKPPRYYAAIGTRGRFNLSDPGILRDMPSPERTLVATIDSGDQAFVAASLAAPPGVRWKVAKVRQVDRIAAWLHDRTQPVVLGMDANTPKWDRHDLAASEWWDDREAILHGVDRAHDLRDAYREYLEQTVETREAVERERPEGPLAVSFERGRGDRKVPCRYDYVYTSPEFEVENVCYRYEDAVAAGSDHALLVAELTLRRDGCVRQA
jgi:endonuclease/exonuclease/phosphatase family metal-dependent hydrolase